VGLEVFIVSVYAGKSFLKKADRLATHGRGFWKSSGMSQHLSTLLMSLIICRHLHVSLSLSLSLLVTSTPPLLPPETAIAKEAATTWGSVLCKSRVKMHLSQCLLLASCVSALVFALPTRKPRNRRHGKLAHNNHIFLFDTLIFWVKCSGPLNLSVASYNIIIASRMHTWGAHDNVSVLSF
jgi:hypothetical protein